MAAVGYVGAGGGHFLAGDAHGGRGQETGDRRQDVSCLLLFQFFHLYTKLSARPPLAAQIKRDPATTYATKSQSRLIAQ